ncbi:MAG: ABC transporter substrate-binding protein [Acidobacteriaceae bacterium]|nr:ABC transporter substrate-binding protein [Acidobacteriaceae bacterium]
MNSNHPQKSLLHVAGIIAAVLCLSANLLADNTEIAIGECAALSGPAGALGQNVQTGLKAALDEANAKGTLNGKKLKLVSADDQYEPDKTVDCTAKLIEENKVSLLAGYVGTPTTKVAVPIAEESKTPLIGIFSGAGIFRQPVQRYVINVRASYNDEAEQLIKYMVDKQGHKKVAVFYQNDSFGEAGLAAVTKALKQRNLDLAAKGSFERNTVAVKAGLADILGGSPDVVVMVGPYKPVAEFVRQAADAHLKAELATISFVGTESLLAELGAAGDGLIISQVVPSPTDSSLPVVSAYNEAVTKSDPAAKHTYASLEGYVTGRLLVAALQKAGTDDKEKVVDAIENMASLDLGGIVLSYNASKHQGSDSVFLTRAQGGVAQPFNLK